MATEVQPLVSSRRQAFLWIGALVALLLLVGYLIGRFFGAPLVGLFIAAGITTWKFCMAYWRGAQYIIEANKAREVTQSEFPELFSMVEELAAKAGVPIPKIYIMDDLSPNAFATGRNPENGIVGVSTGLLKGLNHHEVRGVIAHEIAHIKNRDTFLSLVTTNVIGGIQMTGAWFLRFLAFTHDFMIEIARRSTGLFSSMCTLFALVFRAIFHLSGLLLSVVVVPTGFLMSRAAQRQKEYYADVIGAEISGTPESLASALEKVASDPAELKVATQATAHMFIVNPFKKLENWESLMSTHPPTGERIQRLRGMRMDSKQHAVDKPAIAATPPPQPSVVSKPPTVSQESQMTETVKPIVQHIVPIAREVQLQQEQALARLDFLEKKLAELEMLKAKLTEATEHIKEVDAKLPEVLLRQEQSTVRLDFLERKTANFPAVEARVKEIDSYLEEQAAMLDKMKSKIMEQVDNLNREMKMARDEVSAAKRQAIQSLTQSQDTRLQVENHIAAFLRTRKRLWFFTNILIVTSIILGFVVFFPDTAHDWLQAVGDWFKDVGSKLGGQGK